ncbi:MAG: nitronate monooxygenase, partial [Vicinamibacteria bacterium]|nr:nitronate monooxygenase [Vicinamibacteria bacterium]
RRLQLGDPGGHLRRALSHFPDPQVARSILDEYYVEGGLKADEPFRMPKMFSLETPLDRQMLMVAGGFVEVFLAKEGHDGMIGINFLEKIQAPIPATMYGAILAGIDAILIGAGIPREMPGVIDRLARHEAVAPHMHVVGAKPEDDYRIAFDPARLNIPRDTPLTRPLFLPIIASATLAITLARKANGRVDGFIIEGPIAGGHNAPPRGSSERNARGEPIYGVKDEVDLEKIRALGLPYWLAGGYGSAPRLQEALALGATGVQVGTAFALCQESGLPQELKQRLIEQVRKGEADVFTDPCASPTGFPFKVAQLGGTLSAVDVYDGRERRCDLGYLREAYRLEDGSVGYRCAAEPISSFLAKGGQIEATEGRLCLCNGLMATIGLGQRRADGNEAPLVTAGDDLREMGRLLTKGDNFTAADVIAALLGTAQTDITSS